MEEFVTRPSWIRLAGVTSLAPVGTAATATNARLLVGRTAIMNAQQIPGVGTTISLKDHVITEHGANRGRLFLAFVSGGVATVVVWRVDITPVG
jgi:hypothetical protein